MFFNDISSYYWIIGTFCVALIDFMVIFLAIIKSRTVVENDKESDFAILVPIFNKIDYLKNVPFLAEYGSGVYILTTNKETEEFNESLEKICNLNNFKLFKADIAENQEKTPWLLFSIALHGKSSNSDMITNKTIVLIDGDTYTNEDLGKLVFTLNKNRFDLASVKVMPDMPFSITERLQKIEYLVAMQARYLFPYLTSGAALVGRREVLKRLYARHSMYFQGGDIELGIMGKKMGYNVGHIPFEFFTEVPDNMISLTKQRLSWASGTFRLFVVNIFQNIRNHGWEVFYTLVLIYLMLYIKVMNMIVYFPIIFITGFISYVIILSIVTFKEFSLTTILAPFYSIFQSFILLPLGALIYLRRVILSRNIGWISTSNPKRNAKLLVGNHSLYSNALELNGK